MRKAQAPRGRARNRAMGSNGRTRRNGLGAIALALLGWGSFHALSRPLRAGPGVPVGLPSEGASAEFARTRREQALIRAEGSATMLRALNAAPTLPGAGP